jgi:hypothetical protein
MMKAGSTITLEAWDILYKPNLDWNHAWGAVPANIMPRFVMGVRPLEAGFGKVLIRPQIGSLEAVEGYVPTVRGTVRVGVRQTPGTRYAVTVEVPVNTTARVELPWREGVTLLMDGKAVAARLSGGRFVVDGVSSGRHTLSWQSEEETACGSGFGGRVRKIVGGGWRSWVPFF